MEPLRFSTLKRIGQSPAHYRAAVNQESYDMERGSAVHALVFGTHEVLGWEEGRPRRGRDYEAFEADHPGALILTASEYATARAMAAAIQSHPEAMAVLDGEVEKTMLWDMHGRPCRGTPDVRNDSGRFHTELKTGETSNPRKFQWKVRDFCYHGQLAWYADGAELAGLPRPDDHYIVAQEATAPFVVTVFRIAPKTIDLGRRIYRLWLEQLAACEAADFWPGYVQGVVDLDLEENVEMAFDEAAA